MRASREKVRLAARAKVNLRLEVLAREASGYHQLETVFCALDFADDVEIDIGDPGLTLEIDGAELPTGPDNLVYRAAHAFFERASIEPCAAIRLKKRIPAGAGLGGGSSDAAVTLRGLNLLLHQPLEHQALLELAINIGSDVPFFLCGSSLALAWGRGERLLPLEPLPAIDVVIIAPPFAIVTANAYRALAAQRDTATPRLTPHITPLHRLAGWDTVFADAHNDFQAIATQMHPALHDYISALEAAGAGVAMLSGSGSAVFGLFKDTRVASRAAKRLRTRFPEAKVVETRTAVSGSPR